MGEMSLYGKNEAHGEALEIQKLVDEGQAPDYATADKLHEAERVQRHREEMYDLHENPPLYRSQFLFADPDLSARYQDRITDIQEKLAEWPWLKDKNVRLMVLSRAMSHSGEASPAFGIYTLGEKVMLPGNFESSVALAAHERTHLQVSSEIRQGFLSEHQAVDDFFHQIILPAWEKNPDMELNHDRNYLSFKHWTGLYDGWDMPHRMETDKAIAAVNNYFTLLRKGLIEKGRESLDHIPAHWDLWDKVVVPKPEVPLAEQYQADPQQFVFQLMTGYRLMEYFIDNQRNLAEQSAKKDFLDMDEGFANYIMQATTGVDLQTMQAKFPQDASKVRMAELVIQKAEEKGFQVADVIARVKSYTDLTNFYRELGIVE